jgi:hypothetical protein
MMNFTAPWEPFSSSASLMKRNSCDSRLLPRVSKNTIIVSGILYWPERKLSIPRVASREIAPKRIRCIR